MPDGSDGEHLLLSSKSGTLETIEVLHRFQAMIVSEV